MLENRLEVRKHWTHLFDFLLQKGGKGPSFWASYRRYHVACGGWRCTPFHNFITNINNLGRLAGPTLHGMCDANNSPPPNFTSPPISSVTYSHFISRKLLILIGIICRLHSETWWGTEYHTGCSRNNIHVFITQKRGSFSLGGQTDRCSSPFWGLSMHRLGGQLQVVQMERAILYKTVATSLSGGLVNHWNIQ